MNGQEANALPLINAVRNRSNVSSLAAVTMNDIMLERQVELNYEGSRYQDLLRWGDLLTVEAGQGSAIPTGVITNYGLANADTITESFGSGPTQKNLLLPFPAAEVNVNTNPNFKQNPGY